MMEKPTDIPKKPMSASNIIGQLLDGTSESFSNAKRRKSMVPENTTKPMKGNRLPTFISIKIAVPLAGKFNKLLITKFRKTEPVRLCQLSASPYMMKLMVNQLNHRMSVRFSRIGVLNRISMLSLFCTCIVSSSFISTFTFSMPFFLAISSSKHFASPILDLFPVDINHLGLSQTKLSSNGVIMWSAEKNCS